MTQQLLLVIPYCEKDVHQARALLHWISKISPKLGPHCCLLAADAAVPQETKLELGNIAKGIFYFAETAIINVPADAVGWPTAANAMFRIVSQHIKECFKMPFFWMEPDCVPLKPSWLDEIAVSYSRCPKRFMGPMIQAHQPPMPPIHMAGCSVYPADCYDAMKPYTEGPVAWDIAAAAYTVPRGMNTPLIHHHYGTMELPPTFKDTKEPGDPINTCTYEFLREGATVFHRCKESSLIDLLEKRRHTEPAPSPETVPTAPEATSKRGPGRPKKEPVLTQVSHA